MKKNDIAIGAEYAYGREEDGRFSLDYYYRRYYRCRVVRHGEERISLSYSGSKTAGVWLHRLDKETGEVNWTDDNGDPKEFFVPNRQIRETWDTYAAGKVEHEAARTRHAEAVARRTEIKARNGKAIIAALRSRGFDVDKHISGYRVESIESGSAHGVELSFDAIADLLGITLEEVK